MSTVKIDFVNLAAASSRATSVADELEAYASSLTSGISSALSGIEGGGSSHTNNVASLAQQKARSLRDRAMRYENLSHEIASFSDAAREADATVKAYLSSKADVQAENLTWWQKCGYGLYQMFNGKFGSSEAGAFFDNMLSHGGALFEWGKKFLVDLKEWFKYGNGQYWLNIGISVLGTIGAIIGAILSFPASGFLAALMLGLAAFSAVVSLVNTGFTIAHNYSAGVLADAEPGLARYYGATDSIADYARKSTTDSVLQNLATRFDAAGKIAGVVSFVGGGFVKVAADGTKMGTFDLLEVKSNFASKFGFKLDFDTGKYAFSPGTIFGLGKEYSSWSEHVPWLHVVETIDHIVEPAKNMLSGFDAVLGFDGSLQSDDIKRAVSLTSDLFPNTNGYDKVYGYAEAAYGAILR